MTSPLDDALARLGLRPDADARNVRRAYAQHLKRIDQATQPREFQALREAYELALHVASRREAEAMASTAATEPAPPPAVVEAPSDEPIVPAASPAPTGFQPPDSGDLARAVFQTFAERASAGFKEEEQATVALQDSLADDRLLNLEARTLFELQVAHLIMGGWQPGHEYLFGPACEVFGWERDRSHLRVFGQLGAALDAAINEKLIFFRQSPKDFDLQRNVIRRLRQAQAPSVKQRRADLPIVQMLVQRYPHWLRLVTSQANINSWFHDLPEHVHVATAPLHTGPTPEPQRDRKPASTWNPWFLLVFAVIMLGKLFSNISPPSYQPPLDLGRSQVSATDSPRLNTWPPQSTPSTNPYGLGDPADQFSKLPSSSASARPARESAATTSRAPADLTVTNVEAALNDATSLRPPPKVQRPPPEETVQLGHVTFTRRDGALVVADVGDRTRYSHTTLQPGDRLLGCMSSNYHLPLVQPAEVRNCVATNVTKPEGDVTPYLFRVQRDGLSVPASLTLRSPTGEPASSPETTLKFGAAN